ncbi:hypothetical protein, partial [Escherichia coli]|uniref:hypothetical protein n=1 Tax=Escherichia coli TaxID=562 RepID=UPI00307ACC45
RCFNKSKGVLITGLKLKAFRNPQPSWGFSVHKKMRRYVSAYGQRIKGLQRGIAANCNPSLCLMYA